MLEHQKHTLHICDKMSAKVDAVAADMASLREQMANLKKFVKAEREVKAQKSKEKRAEDEEMWRCERCGQQVNNLTADEVPCLYHPGLQFDPRGGAFGPDCRLKYSCCNHWVDQRPPGCTMAECHLRDEPRRSPRGHKTARGVTPRASKSPRGTGGPSSR